MSTPLDFTMRKILDTKLQQIGTGTSSELRSLDISSYNLGSNTTMGIHLGAGSNLEGLENSRSWIQGTLVKSPQDNLTRGDDGLTHKKSIYVVFVKTDKLLGEYVNEAISSEVEKHFGYNTHITLDGKLLTILKTYQQPSIYIDSDTGRYWNRVFVECEIYDKNI